MWFRSARLGDLVFRGPHNPIFFRFVGKDHAAFADQPVEVGVGKRLSNGRERAWGKQVVAAKPIDNFAGAAGKALVNRVALAAVGC